MPVLAVAHLYRHRDKKKKHKNLDSPNALTPWCKEYALSDSVPKLYNIRPVQAVAFSHIHSLYRNRELNMRISIVPMH